MKSTIKTTFRQTEIGVIPENWDLKKLGEIADKIFVGRDPIGGKQSHSPTRTGYHIIQSAPIFDGHLDEAKIGNISEELYNGLQAVSVKEGDVLLNQLGDGITFARSCVAPKSALPAVVTRSVGVIRCNERKLDPWFLNAYLTLPRTKKYIESFNSGSSRRAIDGSKMRSFFIPLPPIVEQNAIGFFYKAIQYKIELNQKMNKTLESIAQVIFKHWFIDFEFPDENGKPYRSSGGEMVYIEEFGKEIPVGWVTKELTEIAMVVDCLHTKKPEMVDQGPILLQFYNLSQEHSLDLSEEYRVSIEDYELWTRNITVKEGDLLFTNAGGQKLAKVPYWFEGGIGRNLTAVRPAHIDNLYLFRFFLSSLGTQQIYKNIDEGTILNSLNVKGIRKLRVIVPLQEIQSGFARVIKGVQSRIETNLDMNRNLAQIRDLLLPKLMSGKIRVPLEA